MPVFHKKRMKFITTMLFTKTICFGTLTSLFMLFTLVTNAQEVKEPYFGLDIGPKMDIYVNSASSNQYKPNIEVLPDIGASAGIVGGFRINNEFLFELGLYKNDYKMKLNFISDQGNVFFRNSLVRTITSVGVPMSINLKLKRGSPQHQWYAGVGFMALMNVKTDQETVFQSVVEEIHNDRKEVIDKMAYSVSEQEMNGAIVTANVSLRYNLLLSDRMMFHVMGTVRAGVSGRNEFTISHSTLNYSSVTNTFHTKGSGYNINLGFRFYLGFDEEE
jgi:hypothetical protein